MIRVLVDLGARVTVLTASRETFTVLYGSDTSLESAIPDSVRVYRVPFSPEALWPIVNDWRAVRVRNPKRWRQLVAAADNGIFPERIYPAWLSPASQTLLSIDNRDPFDLVIATGNPYVDFEVAHQLHTYASTPFILDDRDSFLFDVYSGDELPEFAQRLPVFRQYLDKALEYWCVNPGIADLHRSVAGRRADVVHVVRNGWDETGVGLPTSTGSAASQDVVRFGYVGTVYPRTPIEQVLAAWAQFRNQAETSAELDFIGSFGFTPQRGVRASQQLALVESVQGVRIHERVANADIGATYGQLDALLFTAPGGGLVTSGKIYEYLATGLPIVALASPELDALTIIRDYPRSHTAPLDDPVAGARAFANARDDALNGTMAKRSQARAYAERYSRMATLGPALERVMGVL